MISRSKFGGLSSSCGGQDIKVFEVALPGKPFVLINIFWLKYAVERGNYVSDGDFQDFQRWLTGNINRDGRA